jgi:hypothetical protein
MLPVGGRGCRLGEGATLVKVCLGGSRTRLEGGGGGDGRRARGATEEGGELLLLAE